MNEEAQVLKLFGIPFNVVYTINWKLNSQSYLVRNKDKQEESKNKESIFFPLFIRHGAFDDPICKIDHPLDHILLTLWLHLQSA